MKLTPQRMLFEGINFLLAVLFVIPLGVLIEQSCGVAPYHGCFIPCLAVIGFLFGRFSLQSSIQKGMLQCAIGFITATVLALFLSTNGYSKS